MKKPILYVDDEEMNLELFDMLLNHNFKVFKANSVDQALELLDVHDDIEVIFTDWRMPNRDGLELAREASEKFDKHIIMISAFMRNSEIDRAIEEGYLSGYLPKPFDRQRIITEVDKLTQLH
ncbi:response regulator [Reichenbachiella versicolor]|uniref:response regulator n=1 Tax=Reichenbachiella versicolor TaxID=1821036 RepID=UPI000D6E77BC|nr:response regulator [Reichenbachiella versicolor]